MTCPPAGAQPYGGTTIRARAASFVSLRRIALQPTDHTCLGRVQEDPVATNRLLANEEFHTRLARLVVDVVAPLGLHPARERSHQQPVFAHLGYATGDFPVTERVQEQALSLPIFPGLTGEQLEAVAAAVREFFTKN